ncbi:YjbF family lipoprotein [uncultured Aliiroseovarius sp.]|uniref:YjbF family lipoprotein n=1 Tax=uncultured Aliiroseovarius sp. TaxID=1658783 RepID=UPI002599E744|nr:YjbF family lipoprotein [uncultured Aliiroseovarius sp.]
MTEPAKAFVSVARATLLGTATAAFLAACGAETSQGELSMKIFEVAKDASKDLKPKGDGTSDKKDGQGAANPNVIVAKALKATPGPVALVVRLDTKAVLAMNPVGRNAGYVTWGSATGQGLTFRNGVLANTRGLGEDLMSSRIDRAVSAITSRGNASYRREHVYLDGVGESQSLIVNCTLRRTKTERVALGAINADAAIMKESCLGDEVVFDNLYWVDGRGRILKSSQWVSQEIGNLAIQNLRL